ncbi:MAG: helix-turn-helix domain-containing protein [Muribaculaceae bacterium]|nr:helix-turn-helix domain-containing protein [Roseburia sp.]MCM1431997.1 helix-turn-helix domain-containing protein [Muribaculaceae bacterium]MCM1493749.1 helix-turn-helix domain-containing protein [Muribaculaceae bacterium]
MHKCTTTQLINRIRKSDDLELLSDYDEDIDNPTVGKFLQEQLAKRDMGVSELASEIMLDRTFVYQMMSGTRMPNRTHLLRIALALRLSLDDAQRMLRIARKGELYPRIRRDAAIIFAVQKKLTISETNEMLEGLGEQTLL